MRYILNVSFFLIAIVLNRNKIYEKDSFILKSMLKCILVNCVEKWWLAWGKL